MFFNIIIGFILPWIWGVRLYKKAPKIILFIAPISSVIAHIINELAVHYRFWKVKPFGYGDFSRLPFDIGLYAVLGSLVIYLIHNQRINEYLVILFFTFLTTIGELMMVLIKRVDYFKGWNIYLTFLSYLIAYILVYIYYQKIKNQKL
ncbi:hypothetical protein [Orenia marismortui]|uniref:Uncharacterized protein n=1 Tax=Orenia marismortui TaxID=46469 RepID=A0A4R8GQW8_9FIRM|nr:hypothetical protein [Orenia marismortui]TDX48210.1 hypothetical protein C7959_1325 [Orenia marismortui]